MTFVKLLVEDEFVNEESIIHTDLDYYQLLNDPSTLSLLQETLENVESPSSNKVIEQTLLYKNGHKNDLKRIAVSCLQIFVAKNWFQDITQLNDSLLSLLDSFFVDPGKYLSLSAECLERSPKFLNLLCVPKYILGKEEGASIWKLRYIMVHQMIDPVASSSLYLDARRTHVSFEGFLTDEPKSMKAKLLKIQVAVELASCLLLYNDVGSSKPLIDNIRDFCDLKIQFSGALGLRTHFQEKATSQLYVKLAREVPLPSDFVKRKALIDNHPKNAALDHESLLNHVNFVNEIEQTNGAAVYTEEELLLLAVASQMKRSGIYSDEIASEELLTLLEFIIDNTSVWVVRYEALLMRSLIERTYSKKCERSMIQLNHLVDSISEWSSKSSNFSREQFIQHNLTYFYSVSMHSNYDVKIAMAESLTSLGCTKSALDIYQELHAWEPLVATYQRLGRKDKAELLVREQIEKNGETPYLLCLLGDATEEISHYTAAWQLSQQKYFRAQRDLGNYYFARKDYSQCIPAYNESLRLNGLQAQIWQKLAYAALSVEDFANCVRAYRRFLELEPDVFEAWNNMSNAYIKLGQKSIAFSTLQEAIKHNFEEWRLWENYLLVAIDVGAFEEAIRSWHRLIDIKGVHSDDQVIEILTQAVLKDLPDINKNGSGKLLNKLLVLTSRIATTSYSSPTLWICHGKLLHTAKKDVTFTIDAIRKVIRSLVQQEGWNKEIDSSESVLSYTQQAINILTDAASRSDIDEKERTAIKHSCKLSIESIIKNASMSIEGWDRSRFNLEAINCKLEKVKCSLEKLLCIQ